MTMPKSILRQIEADFPQFNFELNDNFSWQPKTQTITHPAIKNRDDTAQLLHELSYGLLEHSTYNRDIQLIDMERDAWKHTVKNLAPKYSINLSLSDEIIQDALDSYRNWLHDRSVCPNCNAVGFEHAKSLYRCINCQSEWQVNEAKYCHLRRHLTVKTN